jgi:hypothetical protein
VLTLALLAPPVALAGNANRFKGDGVGHRDKRADVTFRIRGGDKRISDFRARKFKFRCKGGVNDFRSNWIRFEKKFKIRKKERFRGRQRETSNGATLKGKVRGRLDGKRNNPDEAHGFFRFTVDYASGGSCDSKRVDWRADR